MWYVHLAENKSVLLRGQCKRVFYEVPLTSPSFAQVINVARSLLLGTPKSKTTELRHCAQDYCWQCWAGLGFVPGLRIFSALLGHFGVTIVASSTGSGMLVQAAHAIMPSILQTEVPPLARR